jgi:hypothetical protein
LFIYRVELFFSLSNLAVDKCLRGSAGLCWFRVCSLMYLLASSAVTSRVTSGSVHESDVKAVRNIVATGVDFDLDVCAPSQ